VIWWIQVDAWKGVTLVPASVQEQKGSIVPHLLSGSNRTFFGEPKRIRKIATGSPYVVFNACLGFAKFLLELVIGEFPEPRMSDGVRPDLHFEL
jgi:hypothetical protein